METLKALEARKSVRSYLPQEVEQEKLDKIISAGKHAPNAGSFQITVIRNKELLSKINDDALNAMKISGIEFLMQRASIPTYSPLYGAPVVIVLSSQPELYSQANAACAATCMTIAATDLGLGSCYVMTPTLALDGENELSVKAGIAEGNVPICGILLGYEGEEQTLAAAHNVEKPVNYVD